jgi:hypothetical protein
VTLVSADAAIDERPGTSNFRAEIAIDFAALQTLQPLLVRLRDQLAHGLPDADEMRSGRSTCRELAPCRELDSGVHLFKQDGQCWFGHRPALQRCRQWTAIAK